MAKTPSRNTTTKTTEGRETSEQMYWSAPKQNYGYSLGKKLWEEKYGGFTFFKTGKDGFNTFKTVIPKGSSQSIEDNSTPSVLNWDLLNLDVTERISDVKARSQFYQQENKKFKFSQRIKTYIINPGTDIRSDYKDVIQSRRIRSVEMNDFQQRIASLKRGLATKNVNILNKYKFKSFDQVRQKIAQSEKRRSNIDYYHSNKVSEYFDGMDPKRLSTFNRKFFKTLTGFSTIKNLLGGLNAYESLKKLIHPDNSNTDTPVVKTINFLENSFKVLKGTQEFGKGLWDTGKSLSKFIFKSKIATPKLLGLVTKFSRFANVAGPAGEAISFGFDVWDAVTAKTEKERTKKLAMAAGGAIGGILGSFIPIPVVGTMMGYAVGRYAGALIADPTGTFNETINWLKNPFGIIGKGQTVKIPGRISKSTVTLTPSPRPTPTLRTSPLTSNGVPLKHSEIFGIMVRGMNKVIQNTA